MTTEVTSPRLLCVGDNVVDRYVETGTMYPGGNAVNVAVHARRLGLDTGYLGVVGTDPAGDVVRDALLKEGLDLTHLLVRPGPTAYADVRVVGGNRAFGAGHVGVSRFRLTTEQLARLAAYDLVHTGDCSHVEDQLAAMGRATRRLSFDFSERPWSYVAALAPYVDIAVVSLPSGDDRDAEALARGVAALGPDTVAVTRGAAGALLLTDGSLVTASAGDGPIVDTLGAGDAFIARLLVGLVREEPPADALAFATAYATAACAGYGAFGHPGAPIETHSPAGEPAARTQPNPLH